jgi:predicted metal-dependent phosphoesterase TrpH
MKIDLHVHIHATSRCAKSTPTEMAQEAKKRGLDGIVILDHNYLTTKEECQIAERAVPGIRVFQGTEINVVGDDVVLVTTRPIPFMPQYKDRITDLDMLSRYVRESGALAILAHPYRRKDFISFDLHKFTPHAVEIAGRHVRQSDRDKINRDLCYKFDMRGVSVSDAHKPKQIGGFFIDLECNVDSEEQLTEQVKSGKYDVFETAIVPVIRWK